MPKNKQDSFLEKITKEAIKKAKEKFPDEPPLVWPEMNDGIG